MGMLYGWIPSRSRSHSKRLPVFEPIKGALASNPRMAEYQAMMEKCPSLGNGVGTAAVPLPVRYEDPQLQAREDAARDVKHTILPICNKGGYQVITNEADIKTAGRKI